MKKFFALILFFVMTNSGIQRAVEHFESGNGVTEISRVGTVTYKVGSRAFQTFLPAWVSSLNQIN